MRAATARYYHLATGAQALVFDAGGLAAIVAPTDITRALERSTLCPHRGEG